MYCRVSDALLHVGDAERRVVHEVRLAKGVGGAGQKAMRTMTDSCERTELREVKQQLRQQQDIFIAANERWLGTCNFGDVVHVACSVIP